jgi:hypothetical protein
MTFINKESATEPGKSTTVHEEDDLHAALHLLKEFRQKNPEDKFYLSNVAHDNWKK